MKPLLRSSLMGFLALLALFSLLVAPSLWSATKEVKTLETGAAAPEFNLPGVDGRGDGLKDFADAKVLAVVFTCNHCPAGPTPGSRPAAS